MTDPDDRDLLAAEYVLGTLDADERASVAARLEGDASLAAAVAAWEDRLAPLTAAIPDLAPPAAVRDAVMARLFGPDAGAGAAQSRVIDAAAVLRRRLRRWQAAAGGLGLLAASLLGWVALREVRPVTPGSARFTAVLQREPGAPTMVLDIDLAARRLTVTPLLASAPAGRAYELWIIDPALGAPRSLGVVAARAGAAETLTGYDPAVLAGATYAVTIEASGGSPTGQPTAAPILTGKLAPTRS